MIYEECRESPVTFCSNNENREHCIFHSYLATVLLMPCLLNYIVCFYTFFRLTTNRKRYTFIFPLLNLYPQYEAAKLIYSIYKDPVKRYLSKEDYDQNIGLHEMILESVPTTLIIFVILTIDSPSGSILESLSVIEFFITFILSVISASLGLARCLKNGVASSDITVLSILLSCRLPAFFACGLCLVARGFCLESVTTHGHGTPSDLLLSIFLLFAPQCLLAIFSTLSIKNSLKIITHYPYHPRNIHTLLLLPIFTFFTFSKVKVFSCGSESSVRFSKKFTWVNMAVSAFGYVCWLVWYYFRFEVGGSEAHPPDMAYYDRTIPSTLSPLLMSAILTLLLLHLDRCCKFKEHPEDNEESRGRGAQEPDESLEVGASTAKATLDTVEQVITCFSLSDLTNDSDI